MIGVISDTRGLVRSQVVEIFKGAELIIHAGEIGSRQVVKALETISPMEAVRGNNNHVPQAD